MSNNGIEKYKLEFKTLSPINIGSGETLSRFEYVIEGAEIIIIDTNKFMEKLKSLDLTKPSAPKSFKGLEGLKKIDFSNSEINYLDKFIKYINTDNAASLEAFKKEYFDDLYHINFINYKKSSLPFYRLKSEEGDAAYKDISLCVKCSEKAIIPGSSFKGAVWSALIYHYLKDPNELNRVIVLIENTLNRTINDYLRENNLQIDTIIDTKSKYLFYEHKNTEEIFKKVYKSLSKFKFSDDLQKNNGKFMSFSDSLMPQETSELLTEVIEINSKDQSFYQECIKSDQRYNILFDFKHKLRELLLKNFETLKKEDKNLQKPNLELLKDSQSVINIILAFNKAIWNYEKNLINSKALKKKQLENLVEFYKSNDQKSMIKLGTGSSSYSTSIFLSLYEGAFKRNVKVHNNYEINLIDLYKLILWKGKIPKSPYKEVFFPIMDKYVKIDNELFPLGWVELTKVEKVDAGH